MHFRPAEQAWLLAAIVAGIVLSGILAATMSTADSQLLAASSSISHNLLGGFFRVNISEKAAMQAARVSVLAISVIAPSSQETPTAPFSVSYPSHGQASARHSAPLC